VINILGSGYQGEEAANSVKEKRIGY